MPQVGHAGDEGTVGVVGPLVAGVADGGARVGIVALQPVAILLQEEPPPGLVHLGHVILFLLARHAIPAQVGVRRHIAVEGGVGVAQDGDFLLGIGCASPQPQAEKGAKEKKLVSHWV